MEELGFLNNYSDLCYNIRTAGLPTCHVDLKEVLENEVHEDITAAVDICNTTSTDNGNCPKFSVEASPKKRGAPYFVNEMKRTLTTRRNEPIRAKLTGCPPGSTIAVSLRYADEDYCDEIVQCATCHHGFKNCAGDENHLANFCIKSPECGFFYQQYLDGHHAATSLILVQMTEINIRIAFKCLNSCPTHKQHGSRRNMHIEVLDNGGNKLLKEVWSVRVCASVKRDHHQLDQQLNGNGKQCAKRSLSADIAGAPFKIKKEKPAVVHNITDTSLDEYNAIMSEINCDENQINVEPIIGEQEFPPEILVVSSPDMQAAISASEDDSSLFIVKMNNSKQAKMIQDLIKELGGKVTYINE